MKLSDDRIDEIHDEAAEAAANSWSINSVKNPYPISSEEAEIWAFAFRSAYALENGR